MVKSLLLRRERRENMFVSFAHLINHLPFHYIFFNFFLTLQNREGKTSKKN
jgi:hypothetical protein